METENDSESMLVNDEGPNVDLLTEEFKQAAVMQNGGFYDTTFNEESRRSYWAGQSPDGRKWDELMPEGQPAKPWNGCSDTRVPLVDGVCNDDVALLTGAFRKAELRAETVDPGQADVASGISNYLHWLVHTKYKKAFRFEAELGAQYSREHGWTVAYVGWERELGKRRVKFTMDQLNQLARQFAEFKTLPAAIMDPTQDDASADAVRALYREYVTQALAGKGFFEEELVSEDVLDLKLSLAKKYVKALRKDGQCDIPIPYVAKNGPIVQSLKPNQEILAARGTMELQKARAIFWRRWFTEADLDAKVNEGWDAEWIAQAKKTKGNISAWAGALGMQDMTGPSTKTVGYTTYIKVGAANCPLIEVVYGFVKKVDEDGVSGVYETIFSPHLGKNPDAKTDNPKDFCARHELIDYGHGQYPFVEFKQENLGRALTDTRSVAEVAHTWQGEEKEQRDMLMNRSHWDTLPPYRVPKLGGTDYKLGPGAQVPLSKNQAQDFGALNYDAPAPSLAMELIDKIHLQTDAYFGRANAQLPPGLVEMKQEKAADDFYIYWETVLLMVFSLQVQYNPEEIVRVTGNAALADLDPFELMEQIHFGLEFDIKEMNPDYLLSKLDTINKQVLPGDVTGAIDRGALTAYATRSVDPMLAGKLLQDQRSASQKTLEDVQGKVAQMMLGFEPAYVENDPTAPMKLQYLQQTMATNPKVKQFMQGDPRFKALLDNYAKNLQMSVSQQQNKQIGRIGVQPIGQQAGGAGA